MALWRYVAAAVTPGVRSVSAMALLSFNATPGDFAYERDGDYENDTLKIVMEAASNSSGDTDQKEDPATWCVTFAQNETPSSSAGTVHSSVLHQVGGEQFYLATGDMESSQATEDDQSRYQAFAVEAQRRVKMMEEASIRMPSETARLSVSLDAEHTKAAMGQCSLTLEEAHFLKCPPGNYMPAEDRHRRESRFRLAMCRAKERGWLAWVGYQNSTMNYKERGFATFESALFPKDSRCRQIPGQKWQEEHGIHAPYRLDTPPPGMPKDVCPALGVEFHRTWKVASSTLPQYMKCKFPGDWLEVESSTPVVPGGTVIAAVRHPVSRWLSAVGEILQRVVNGYCPNGPCTERDDFFKRTPGSTTRDSVYASTTWYKKVSPAFGGYTKDKLQQLVEDFVFDTKCNFDFYAAPHLSSQSLYVSQNAGEANGVDYAFKLEKISELVENLTTVLLGNATSSSPRCSLVPGNVEACKPQRSTVPSNDDLLQALGAMPKLVQELCLVYAQDFVCFDYELPDACKSMF